MVIAQHVLIERDLRLCQAAQLLGILCLAVHNIEFERLVAKGNERCARGDVGSVFLMAFHNSATFDGIEINGTLGNKHGVDRDAFFEGPHSHLTDRHTRFRDARTRLQPIIEIDIGATREENGDCSANQKAMASPANSFAIGIHCLGSCL